MNTQCHSCITRSPLSRAAATRAPRSVSRTALTRAGDTARRTCTQGGVCSRVECGAARCRRCGLAQPRNTSGLSAAQKRCHIRARSSARIMSMIRGNAPPRIRAAASCSLRCHCRNRFIWRRARLPPKGPRLGLRVSPSFRTRAIPTGVRILGLIPPSFRETCGATNHAHALRRLYDVRDVARAASDPATPFVPQAGAARVRGK